MTEQKAFELIKKTVLNFEAVRFAGMPGTSQNIDIVIGKTNSGKYYELTGFQNGRMVLNKVDTLNLIILEALQVYNVKKMRFDFNPLLKNYEVKDGLICFNGIKIDIDLND